MLYIVQVILSGIAEKPQVFVEKDKVESAFVAYAKEYWRQPYADFCEERNLDRDAFPSARAFVDTFEASGKSTINLWVIEHGAGHGDSSSVLARKQREHVVRLAKDVEDGVRALAATQAGLLEQVTKLTEFLGALEASGAADDLAVTPAAETAPSSPAPSEVPEASTALYSSPEWKSFVGSVRNLGSGPRNEYDLLPRQMWRDEIYSNVTSFDYWEWVADRLHRCKEKALRAGYSVKEDAESPGHYRFVAPGGVTGEEPAYSEWEAWCLAGMQCESGE